MSAMIRALAFSHDVNYVPGSIGAKLRQVVSVTDAPFNARGNGVADDTAAIQAVIDAGYIAHLPKGVYLVTAPIVVKDGTGLVGDAAFWKRRTGYAYGAATNSVIKYGGAAGANTCVVRASETAVGVLGTDFTTPGTDDLVDVVLRDFHVDAAGLADFGLYVYRAGNQATIGNVTAERAVKACHVQLGCYAAQFGTFGAYESQGHGVICGWDAFAWGSVEATNFAYAARFLTANNGTANTYVAGTATDLDGSGGQFSVGRGSAVRISSEGNKGRACVLSQHNIASGAGGPSRYQLDYIEANGDGPYIDYRDGMDALVIGPGFLHPGNGGSLVSQNIKIEGKNNAGVVTADAGPTDRGEWLVLDGLMGDLSGVGIAVSSNTAKFVRRGCSKRITYPASKPFDDTPETGSLVGAACYFTAAAAPVVWHAHNCTIARTSAGNYTITFDRPFATAGQQVPMVSIAIKSVPDQKVEITSVNVGSVAIRTRDAAGVVADTNDRIGFMMAGPLGFAYA